MQLSTPSRWLTTLALAAALLAACADGAVTEAPAASPAPTTSSAATTAAEAGRTAQISELLNAVDAKRTTGADWAGAAEGDQINAGGRVRTAAESRVRIDTSDNSIIRIGAQTEFELLEFSTAATDPVTRLQLEAGKLWVWVTKDLGAGTFEVDTPAGVATVRGSLMSVAFDRDLGRLAITCLEGECELRDRAQTVVQLVAGQASEIASLGQGPLAARRMTRLEVQEWLDNFPEAGEIARRLLATLRDDETPTPASGGGGGQTACDHPYLPMRPGASWTYQTPDGLVTWAITSVTGDAQSATAVMTFSAEGVTGSYNWTCSAATGLVSYDFGRVDFTGLGAPTEFNITNSSGSWLPPASALVAGYAWENSYEQTMKMTLPDNAGTGEGQTTHAERLTVSAVGEVSVGGQTYPSLTISRSGSSTISFTLGGIAMPGQTLPIEGRSVMALGVGIVEMADTINGTSYLTQLVSFTLP